jgi:thymidine kinase
MDYHFKTPKGSVEVICGSMFSGKTEELLRRINRCILAQLRVEMFKPLIDTRYKADAIVSHMGRELPCQTVTGSGSIVLLASQADVVAIDEAQFFDFGLVAVCQELAAMGKRVIIAGLDMDSNAEPFGPMPALMAVADQVYKVQAICAQCGNLAYVSYRIANESKQIHLGEKDAYKPLCRTCFLKHQHA